MVDLYEEWLKQNEENAVSANNSPASKSTCSSDNTSKQNANPE